MPIPGKRLVARRLAAVSFLLLAAVAAVPPAHAAPPSELFFSEYVEGSSNNKALEIYNGTGAAINLATGGYNVQVYFNGSASAGLTINLTVTIFVARVVNTSTGDVSATVVPEKGTLSTLPVYRTNGTVRATTGDVVADSLYLFIFADYLNAGAGGFVLK